MKLRKWFGTRGSRYILQRGLTLTKRYGLNSAQARERILATVAELARDGCAPTFPTPGSVVDRYPGFIRRLQDMSAEIAVHGYHHVDLKAYTPHEALTQLKAAVRAFERHSIDVRGFRCPYLSGSDPLMDVLPEGMFRYGSNSAFRWDADLAPAGPRAESVIETIDGLYRPREAAAFVSVPWMRGTIVEIPVTVPDDLQLHDGWGLGPDGLAEVWRGWLDRAHRRGELFDLMFHPELADICRRPLALTLREARRFRPAMWVSRLRDIGDWWWERSGFRSLVTETSAGPRVSFFCSPRATVLVRGFGPSEQAEAWDGSWLRWRGDTLEARFATRPFVGVSPFVPETVTAFLRDQGYVLDEGVNAPRCGLFLDRERLAGLGTEVALVDWIEGSDAPLVKYGRWPDGAKGAFCMSGDLDALSLRDYLSRLFHG
jgi:hypothetical protein